jgi:putative transposase
MMAGFVLRKNMAFEWNGARFRIDRFQANGDLLLERVDDGQFIGVTRTELLSEYAKGNVAASVVLRIVEVDGVPLYSRPLQELPHAIQQEVRRRQHYVRSVLSHGRPIFTRAYLTPLLRHAAAELDEKKPPGITSFYRWYRRLRTNDDPRALIPRYDRRGSKDLRQDERVVQLASDAIEESFKMSPLATGRDVYTRLVAKIKAENHKLLGEDQFSTPCLRTVYRMLERTEVYEMTCLKEGKVAADKRFRAVKAGVKTTQILERVEIDHTPLDLFIVDEKTWLPHGRPTLTVVIDHYSRMLLGYHLSFDNPSTAAVMGALRHAILPKGPIKETLAGLKVEHPWPCYGRPDVMVVDNGLEFHGRDLESVCFDLGIRIQYCPKHQPRFKGVVERFLKTINYFFAHQLPGTSFARFHLRGDYDPVNCAMLTLAEFQHVFEKWVVDIYSQTKHRGLGMTPWARWHEGAARREPELPDTVQSLQRRIGLVTERSLRANGIALEGIRYNGKALEPILRKHGIGIQVRVLYDTEDLGEIQVWGPDEQEPVTVLALDQQFARGLTGRQNKLIQQWMREKGADSEDPVALERARFQLADTVSNLMFSRKQTDRRRSAALRGMSSSRPETPALFPEPPRKDKLQLSKQHVPASPSQGADELPPLLKTFQLKR